MAIFRSIVGPFATSDLYPSRPGDASHVLLDAEIFDADPPLGVTIDAWALGLVAVLAVGSSTDARVSGEGLGPRTSGTSLEADGRGTGAAVPRTTSTGLEADGRGTGAGAVSTSGTGLEADGRGAGAGLGPSATSTGFAREAVITLDVWALAVGPRTVSDASVGSPGVGGSGVAPRTLSSGAGGPVGPVADVLEEVDARASTSHPGTVAEASPEVEADGRSGGAAGAAEASPEVEADGWALGWVLGPEAAREVTGAAGAAVLSRAGEVVPDVTGEAGAEVVEGSGSVVEISG